MLINPSHAELRIVIALAAIAVVSLLGPARTHAQSECSSSTLVLTEIDLGGTDILEIQNVSGGPVDTAGWAVAISESPYSDPNTVNPIVQALPATMAAGEIIYWTDSSSDNYWGSNMFWNPGDFPSFSGWAIILDDTGAIVDFAVWNGMPEADIAGLTLSIGAHTVTIDSEWLLDGIVSGADCGDGLSVQRQGDFDQNDATDWTCEASNPGVQNPDLVIPFTDGGSGCILDLALDIKPGSDPNSIDPFSRGVIPVAILTTEAFDALTVDADSVLFGPAEAEKVHKRAHVEDVDDDGDLDLVLHFRTEETGIALGDTEACVIGQTYDGVPIMGCDSVRTVPPS